MLEEFDIFDQIENKIIKNVDKWIYLLEDFIKKGSFTKEELIETISNRFPSLPVNHFIDYLIFDGYIEVDENDENFFRVSDKSYSEYNFLTDPNYSDLVDELLKIEEEVLDGEDPYEKLE